MKNKLALLACVTAFLFSSCSKNDDCNTTPTTNNPKTTVYGKNEVTKVTRAYQDYFEATSTITPTPTGVFNPGSGEGRSTHFGQAKTCFNQIVNFMGSQPIGSSAAPVSQFYAGVLANAGITNLPSQVSSITYDKDGNSVWFTSTSGTSLSPVSATRVNFSASLVIIGGTGKFTGATGSVLMSGYFNPQTANQVAVIQTNGIITY